MIVKKYIEQHLTELDRLYNQSMASGNTAHAIYYSKLAVLELSGWIEESFDDIANRSVKGVIYNPRYKKICKQAIKRNHGFNYDGNFLVMMTKIVGIEECQRLESYLDSTASLSVLCANIDALHMQRRYGAHTYLSPSSIGFDAPSITLSRLKRIFPIIREMYSWFCNRR